LARLRFHVLDGDAGARLDRVLAGRPELESRALAERLIATGAVLVDGEPRAKSFRLEGGEAVDVEIPDAAELQRSRENIIRRIRNEYEEATDAWKHDVKLGCNYLFLDMHVIPMGPKRAERAYDPWEVSGSE